MYQGKFRTLIPLGTVSGKHPELSKICHVACSMRVLQRGDSEALLSLTPSWPRAYISRSPTTSGATGARTLTSYAGRTAIWGCGRKSRRHPAYRHATMSTTTYIPTAYLQIACLFRFLAGPRIEVGATCPAWYSLIFSGFWLLQPFWPSSCFLQRQL